MIKRLLFAAAAAATVCATARAETWSFTYQGFTDATTGIFAPDMRLTGRFGGQDKNGDGVITLKELTYMYAAGQEYLGSWRDGCVDSTSQYLKCSIVSFSFKLTGQLAFDIGYEGNDEFSSGWYGGIITGDRIYNGAYGPVGEWERRYLWSDRTTLTLDPAPVPEPSIALLLPLGMAVLAARRRGWVTRSTKK
ncbi:putative secreted protein with PEP-CTERM sorting signal [Pseudoduganella flava]|uniref:PEP-CTERM sorting domain-containing protein n=1 Tax=Pseudoduganella flava TaxID=871742 RepID=A0A562PWC4_9BURK|nr:PEP-CTERM sorting domain-containing protein [Pseudoduganella flava]QGZ39829.1 PEP-CTERM sorting domain-containing protein [Pseudoduganella flava]TWI48751.1 putative secreted protein with PEP-CTERM sorting signal [Pseudoduganella flava]